MAGLGCEDALTHLLNFVWPNIFETSPHVVQAVQGAIDGCRLALGPSVVLSYTLQGLFHPARKVCASILHKMWQSIMAVSAALHFLILQLIRVRVRACSLQHAIWVCSHSGVTNSMQVLSCCRCVRCTGRSTTICTLAPRILWWLFILGLRMRRSTATIGRSLMFSSDPQLSKFNSASAGFMQQTSSKKHAQSLFVADDYNKHVAQRPVAILLCPVHSFKKTQASVWAAAGGLCWKGEGLAMQHLGGAKAEGSHHAFVGSNASSCCIISVRSDFERPLRFSRQDFRRAHLIPPAVGHGLPYHSI